MGLVIEANLLRHQLGGVVDALGILRVIFRHRLVGRRAVFAQHRTIDALGAGIDHARDVERARGLEHVHHPHHVDLDAERRIGRGDRADERRGVNDMRDPMPFDDVEQARHVEHVAELDVDLLEDVANEPLVAMAGKDDGAVSFAYEPAARFRADHAHPAGDQDFHSFS
jgi:hypothetical protein